MINKELTQILKKYLPKGIIRGSEFLLDPIDTISFIEDLANFGVRIVGIELWTYKDKDHCPNRLLEIPGAGGLLDNYLEPNADLKETNKTIRNFILEHMEQDIPEADMISLVYLDDEIYDFFIETGNKKR